MIVALDGEELVDAPHRLDRDRRLARLGEVEEFAPPVRPAGRFDDRRRLARRLVELVEAGIGVGLHDAGLAGEMLLRMFAGAIARIIEEGRRRILAAERPVVAHIGP